MRVRKPVQSKALQRERFRFALNAPQDWHTECHAFFDQFKMEIPLQDRVRAGRGCKSNRSFVNCSGSQISLLTFLTPECICTAWRGSAAMR